ncbi:MAG: hypothetical protein ACR2OE_14775 [Thermomicrobiales bacterium]
MSEIRLGRYQQTLIPFIRPADALRSALYVVGSPGMGKSTLLGNLCEQYCAAGDGVLLLDLKGDLARDIAHRSRHPERIIYVQPGIIRFADGERVWTLNPFAGHRPRPDAMGHIAVNVLESFDRMGRTELSIMANIRQSLAHAIRLALTTPEPTLLDLLLIVVDQSYRQELLRRARALNHVSRRFWSDLDDPKLPARERRGQLNTTRNRLEALLMDRDINLFVGNYESTLKLREWLDEGRMILIDLGLPLPRGIGIDKGGVPGHLIVQLGAITLENLLDKELYRSTIERLLLETMDKSDMPELPTLEDNAVSWPAQMREWSRNHDVKLPSKIAVANRIVESASVVPSQAGRKVLADLHQQLQVALKLAK